ncbi:MAG: hotdog fold domain-containing protein [Usitatibacter sp.]
MNRALAAWLRFEKLPFGKALFSRLISWKAPYFASIAPRFEELRPGYARVSMRKRRAVTNHIGTVHAIAMCNLAEIAAGTMTEVSIPATMRWLPKGMQVEYLRKAGSDVQAVAQAEEVVEGPARDVPVRVDVQDQAGELVCRATITMWVSPRKN